MTDATHTTAPAADLNAAYDFISALALRSDSAIGPSLLWGGWALRDAFLAGIARERASHDGLVEALRGFGDDYMVSDRHHPDHVLIPRVVFDRVRRALEAAGIKAAIE